MTSTRSNKTISFIQDSNRYCGGSTNNGLKLYIQKTMQRSEKGHGTIKQLIIK